MLLYQPNNGYRYNSDTHFLFSFIKQNLAKYKNIKGNLLDIGCGSGILGLLCKRDYPNLDLYSCEKQDSFSMLTKKNSEVNSLATTLIQGDFQTIDFGEKKFDIIVSNPPFYPSSVIKSENENLKIARYNDFLPIEDFIEGIARNLSPNGKVFFCYDVKLLDTIINLAKKFKLNIEALQFLHPKASKKATLVMVHMRKNSKSSLDILPPVIMFEDDMIRDEINEIYKMCDTYSIKVEI